MLNFWLLACIIYQDPSKVVLGLKFDKQINHIIIVVSMGVPDFSELLVIINKKKTFSVALL